MFRRENASKGTNDNSVLLVDERQQMKGSKLIEG